MTIGPMADEGNVVDFFGDKMGFKLINMYQAFLKHYGGTASDDDYEYLQGQQGRSAPPPLSSTPPLATGPHVLAHAYPLTHSRVRAFVRQPARLPVYPLAHPPIHPAVLPSARSRVRPSTCAFVAALSNLHTWFCRTPNL